MSGTKNQLIPDESELKAHSSAENQLVVHVLAPIAAMAATWAARKVLNSSYSRLTGHKTPDPQDAQVALGSALAWAAITAASAAVVEVAVFRFLAKKG
jgi:hypothetical protein